MSLSKHNTIAVDSVYGSPTCEIITIGTELLLGQIVDTNTTYLAQEVGRAGVIVRFRTAVGDHLEEIIETLACAIERCDMVVTTGGLGPTLDDLTREAVARTAGRAPGTPRRCPGCARCPAPPTGRPRGRRGAACPRGPPRQGWKTGRAGRRGPAGCTASVRSGRETAR